MFDAGGAVPLSYNDRCRIPFGQGFHDAPGSGGTQLAVQDNIHHFISTLDHRVDFFIFTD